MTAPIEILEAGVDCIWIWHQIHLAENLEQLIQVSIDIGNDKWEEEPYTKDERAMETIRAAYSKRRAEYARDN